MHPLGIQFAPRFGEATLFQVAHAYESATDWHTRLPSPCRLNRDRVPGDVLIHFVMGWRAIVQVKEALGRYTAPVTFSPH
jgi:hypothetical protein